MDKYYKKLIQLLNYTYHTIIGHKSINHLSINYCLIIINILILLWS